MSNISQVKKESNWGDASTTINSNFQNLNTDLEKVKSSTTKFKGYFTSESSLKDKYPSPQSGDTAWVGEPYPGKVYDVQSGQWHNTNTAPDTGSVDLQDYATKAEVKELEDYTKKSITEYNVSVFHPTSGPNGDNKYTLETAIVQVPAELRTAGLTVSFLNESGDTEKWEFAGGSWAISSFEQVGAGKLNELDTKHEQLLDIALFGKIGDISLSEKNITNSAIDVIQQEIGNVEEISIDTIELRPTALTGNITIDFLDKIDGVSYKTCHVVVSKFNANKEYVEVVNLGETVNVKPNSVLKITSTSRIYFVFNNNGEYKFLCKVGNSSVTSNYNLCYSLYNSSNPGIYGNINTLKEDTTELKEGAEKIGNSTDYIEARLFGKDSSIVGMDFSNETSLNRTRIMVIFPDNPIKYDNTIIKGLRFKSAANYQKVHIVSWNGIEGEGGLLSIKDTVNVNLAADTYFDYLDLGASLVANKGDYIAIDVCSCVDPRDGDYGLKYLTFDNSNYQYTGTYANGAAIEIFYEIGETYTDTIQKLNDTHILTNLVPINFTEEVSYVSKDDNLTVEKVDEGIRIYGVGTGEFRSVGFIKSETLADHRYCLFAEIVYNTNPKTLNGRGFIFGKLANLGINLTANIREAVEGTNLTQYWCSIEQCDESKASKDSILFFRAYPQSTAQEDTIVIDITIKRVFLFDLGIEGDYFYNKDKEYFISLLKNRKPFNSLCVCDTSSDIANNNSLYKGKILKSLGNSMPETRSYQYIIANAIGAIYNGDLAGEYTDETGTHKYLSSVKGGTWCAPVTTKSGGTQTIEQSAYIRCRYIKHQKPDILIIQCCENDAAYFSDVYKGTNADGTPYDYGLNDKAYEGDGVDLSDGVYQDEEGHNLAPSLGASYRGMLKQLFTDMPLLRVICVGIPRDSMTIPDNPNFQENYYNSATMKNEVIKKVAGEFGCPYVDLFNEYGPNSYNIDQLTIDGIHYSTYGGERAAMVMLATAF